MFENDGRKKLNSQKKYIIAVFSLLVLVTPILSGCAGVNPAATTTPATTTPATSAQDDTLTIEGLILTNGTILVTKAPEKMGIMEDLLVVHLKEGNPSFIPGSLVEFTIKSAIAESYPPQAQGISSRLISQTSPVLKIPTPMTTRIKFHLGEAAMLIDVRTPEEYKSGYIPEAINIPLDTLKTEILKQAADKTKTLMVYCRSGSRSAEAAKQLKELGYPIVLDLGGIIDFKEELVK